MLQNSENRTITDDVFQHIHGNCTKGEKGDSRFVRDLAEKLWDRCDLACRSVTGSACVNVSKADAFPECTPYKKQILHGKLMLFS